MELKTAVALIEKGVPSKKQRWADLGAGSGTFTQALATVLKEGSVIHAVDRDLEALSHIPLVKGREILKEAGELQQTITALPRLDGVLMANALHYIRNQETLITSIMNHLAPGGRLVIVEYDMDSPNVFIPYPVSYASLHHMISKTKFACERIGHAPSRYQKAGLYAALIT